jgi:hypothetical protein
MIIPHQLKLTQAQMKKLHQGLPIQIKYDNMGADKGDAVIGLKEGNAKKLMSAFKKGKGVRMCLDDEESEYSMKEGSGIFGGIKKGIKKGVSKVKRGLKSAERKIETTANKIAKPVKGAIRKYVPKPFRDALQNEAQGLINMSAKSLGDMIAEATGDDEFGEMIANSISQTGDNLLTGQKLRVGSQISPIAKRAVNLTIQQIDDPQYKAIAMALAKQAGSGLYAGKGLTGKGLSGMGLSGMGLSGLGKIIKKGVLRETKPVRGRFEKGSQEAKDYMASIRKGKGMCMNKDGDGLGNIVKKVGKQVKKTASKGKKALFGKRMSDEAEFLLPLLGGIGGTTLGGLAGMPTLGGVGGTAAGERLAREMKKKGMGLRGRGRPPIKPASDVMTLSPYTSINAPAFNPFYPTNSFQNGGSGDNL